MLTLAVLAAAAVFNVGVVNPDTHLIESYLSCDVDYETAVAIVLAEKSHYLDKVLAIFDDDARTAWAVFFVGHIRVGRRLMRARDCDIAFLIFRGERTDCGDR